MIEASQFAGVSRPYCVISADCHVNEPANLWATRIDARYRDRIPRVELDAQGQKWSVAEGLRPVRIKDFPKEFSEGQAFSLESKDLEFATHGTADVAARLRDHAADGVDAEVIYPNKGLLMWTSSDHALSAAMCRVWNDWVGEVFGPASPRQVPVAALAPGDVPAAVQEVVRVAELGFRTVFLPVQVPGMPYNDVLFDPLWAVLQETGLPVSFHVGTGRDPREATGNGGAVINYVTALSSAITPVTQLCASGVCERFPGLRFVTVECGIGWLAWTLHAMDEAYVKHSFWVFTQAVVETERLFPPAGLVHFQRRSDGPRDAPLDRQRPVAVRQRLSASRRLVATLA